MIKKHNYEAPDAELLVVKFEENILSGFSTAQKNEYFTVEEEEAI